MSSGHRLCADRSGTERRETEAKLRSLEEQAKSSATALQKIAAKGEKLKEVGDNVTNVGKKFLPVTAGK